MNHLCVESKKHEFVNIFQAEIESINDYFGKRQIARNLLTANGVCYSGEEASTQQPQGGYPTPQ